jgi:hypothetical protein
LGQAVGGLSCGVKWSINYERDRQALIRSRDNIGFPLQLETSAHLMVVQYLRIKNIFIFYVAPKENFGFISPIFHHCGNRNCGHSGCSRSLWPQDEGPFQFTDDLEKWFRIFIHRECLKSNFTANVSSGRQPDVFPSYGNDIFTDSGGSSWQEIVNVNYGVKSFSKNKSAQLLCGGPFASNYEPSRGEPEEESAESQNESKGCDGHGSCGGYSVGGPIYRVNPSEQSLKHKHQFPLKPVMFGLLFAIFISLLGALAAWLLNR